VPASLNPYWVLLVEGSLFPDALKSKIRYTNINPEWIEFKLLQFSKRNKLFNHSMVDIVLLHLLPGYHPRAFGSQYRRHSYGSSGARCE